MSDSIKVAIKVRPLIKREKDENVPVQWEVQNDVIIPLDTEIKKRSSHSLTYDHVFGPEKTNINIFDTVVKPIVKSAVDGFNGTIFAYGQTSSGKTYTMMGTDSEPGIVPLAVRYIFDAIADTRGREFLLRVSYLEIYNEKVNDLLEPLKKDLKLREDNNGLVQVLDCKEEVSNSPEYILEIMKRGDKNRRIGQTDMNEQSSRSHTIFRLTIESRKTSSETNGAVQVSQLNLVDLAGSERATQTNDTGERFKEGTHINLSLSTLGLVIKQLSEAAGTERYINFRDSKLTRLLQASLGGNAMTVIICAITPASLDETQCTLSFASRAKSIKNKPQLNEIKSDAVMLKRYKDQIAKLNAESEDENLKKKKKCEELEGELKEKERINKLLQERIELLNNMIITVGDRSPKTEKKVVMNCARRRQTWPGNFDIQLQICLLPNLSENKNPDRNKTLIEYDLDDLGKSLKPELEDFELQLIKNAKNQAEIFSLGLTSNSLTSTPQQSKSKIRKIGNRSGLGGYATPKNFEEKINRFHEESPIIQNLNILKKQLNAEEQFNDLNCLVKLKFYYDSVEKIIGSLVTYYPEIFSSWQPSHLNFSLAQNEEIICELQKLEELLIGAFDKIAEKEEINADYDECFKLLENERDDLKEENSKTMEKLLKKDAEILELREKLINLENKCMKTESRSKLSLIESNQSSGHFNPEERFSLGFSETLNILLPKKELKQEHDDWEDRFKYLENLSRENDILESKRLLQKYKKIAKDFLYSRNIDIQEDEDQLFETELKSLQEKEEHLELMNMELLQDIEIFKVTETELELKSKELQSLQSLLDVKTNEIQILKKTDHTLTATILDFKKLKEKLNQENDQKSSEIEQLKNKLNDAAESENVLKTKIADLQKFVEQLKFENNDLKKIADEKLELEKKICSGVAARDTLNIKILNLELENDELRKSVTKIYTESEKNIKHYTELNKTLNDRVLDSQKLNDQLEIKNSDLQKIIEDGSNKIKKFQDSENQKLEFILEYKKTILNLQKCKKQLECQNKDLRKVTEEKSLEIDELYVKYKELKQFNIALESKKDQDCKNENQSLKINKYKEMNGKLMSKIENLEHSNGQLLKEQEFKNSQMQEKEALVSSLTKRLREAHPNLMKLQKNEVKLLEENENLKERLEKQSQILKLIKMEKIFRDKPKPSREVLERAENQEDHEPSLLDFIETKQSVDSPPQVFKKDYFFATRQNNCASYDSVKSKAAQPIAKNSWNPSFMSEIDNNSGEYNHYKYPIVKKTNKNIQQTRKTCNHPRKAQDHDGYSS